MRDLVSVLLALILLSGCSGNSSVTPANPADPGIALGAVHDAGSSRVAALAFYDLAIDPATGSVRATLRETRTAQDNADLYLLPISKFLNPGSFKLIGLGLTNDTVDVRWQFTHPFRSSGDIPRSDLGFTGYLMFLADVPTAAGNTYFEGSPEEVVLNGTTVANADVYWKPAGLLNLQGITADAFPCQLVVDDEDGGNRIDPGTGAAINNGGDVHGNFDPAIGGWQTGQSKSWTGFDVLHQGQASVGTLSIKRAAIGTEPFHLTMAVVARYNDPRSATPGRFHRNPGAPPDVLGEFGYRFPHGCLDVSRIRVRGLRGSQRYLTHEESEPTFSVHVRDWDAQAPTSIETDLALEVNPGLVLPTSTGSPAVAICIPGVIGDAAYSQDLGIPKSDDDAFPFGDSSADSGEAEDEYWYSAKVPKPDDFATVPGTYLGVVAVTDAAIAAEAQPVALQSDLMPVTANAPVARTYHAFTVDMGEGGIGDGWATQLSGIGTDVLVSLVTTPTGECYFAGTCDDETDLGGDPSTPPYIGTIELVVGKLDANGGPLWLRTYGSNDIDDAADLALDPSGNLYFTGTVFGDSIQFDPSGPTHTPPGPGGFVLKLEPDGDYLWSKMWSTGTGAVEGRGIAVTAGDEVIATGDYLGTADFGAAGTLDNDSEFNFDAFLLALDSDGVEQRVAKIGGSEDAFAMHCVAQPDGSIAVGGFFSADMTFGATTRSSVGDMDAFVASFDPADFSLNWDHEYGSPLRDTTTDVALLAAGYLGITGTIRGPEDFGEGIVSLPAGPESLFAVTFKPDGSPNWAATATATGTGTPYVRGRALVGDTQGNVYLLGQFSGTLDPPLNRYGSNGDNLFVKLSPTGSLIWSRQTGAFERDTPGDIGLHLNDNLVYAYTFEEITVADPENSTAFINGDGPSDGMLSMILRSGNW